MFGNDINTQKNGEPASSTLIMLLAWVINNMPNSALTAVLNTLGLGSKRSSATELLENILYMDTIKTFRNAGRSLEIKVEDYAGIINTDMPFTLKTLYRRHMIRESGWISGRSKLMDSADRALKSSVELVDAIRNYCEQCDEYMPWLGIDAPQHSCNYCGRLCELKTRHVAASDQYEPVIKIPLLLNGMLDKIVTVNLKTITFESVQNALLRGDWKDEKQLISSTPKKHILFGLNEKGNLKVGRINALVCRIPVLNEVGELVSMWAAVPCGWTNNGMISRGWAGIKGDLYDDFARKFHGLSDAEIKRIETFNETLIQRSKLISMLTEKRRKFGKDDHKIVKEWQKRYPASKSYDMKIVARTHDMRNKVIET